MRVLALLATFGVLLAGCTSSTVSPARPVNLNGLHFVVLGDAPYSQAAANLLDGAIDEINRTQPAFVVHVGDITGGRGPCTDEWLRERRAQFARIKVPFVLVPGDNEWTDCHRTGFDPLDRLARVRSLFHAAPPALPSAAVQSKERPEHMRWQTDGVLFVTLNVPGSNNNLGRTAAMDKEHAERMFAAEEWLDDAVALAEAPQVRALVVFLHANPDFERSWLKPGMPDGYATLRTVLATHANWLKKPLVLIHGDSHSFKHDRPMPNAPSLVRIEVDGFPDIGWLHITVPDQRLDEPWPVVRQFQR